VNFEYRPGKLQLLLGGNGSGKSTVFEVLGLLRAFVVDRAAVGDLFTGATPTRWQTRVEQSFELSVVVGGKAYVYKLGVHHSELPWDDDARVDSEELVVDGVPVLSTGATTDSDGNYAGLYSWLGQNSPFPVDDSRSSLPLAPTRGEVRPFENWIRGLHWVRVNPYAMSGESTGETRFPARDLSNYASWYRHLTQEQPRVAATLLEYLMPVIAGFGGFLLTAAGERARTLRAEIRAKGEEPRRYGFGELSDGQRALAGLYTLLALMKDTPITLCIDEPDNFVALPEIQPWLMELQDAVEKHGSQALVISHHPEFINYLAPMDAVWFSREAEGPVRVAPFVATSDEPLSAAELVRRGWKGNAASE
jgi:ABC-type molybdenum transport system ATPase subunit/photorepair protein PhrA